MNRPPGSVSYDNSGRVALVTGAARGIGRAIAEALVASRCRLVLGLDRLAGESDRFECMAGDVTRPEDCARAVASAVERGGGLDILVNNAAIQPAASYQGMGEADLGLLEEILRVNVLGYANMARAALPVMVSQQRGVVINLASAQGHRTARGVPAYGPAKAANLMQAMQWGVEYARQGVRVVSVSPGAIDTPMLRASLAAQGGAGALANRHPLGRLGKPDEIASAVLWLASDGASFITATDLAVDGGLNALAAFADPYPPL